MGLLPGVVPEIPGHRAGLVAARLARKVAPLFGMPWEGSPFGLTWVCDFEKITLSEIARGAPAPSRSATPALESEVPAGQWRIAGRTVVTHRGAGRAKPEPLPDEIANATLTRYGPNTKAAVMLTAANTLLRPVTEAISEALSFLEQESGNLPLRLRLGAWATLTLEAFRSQPALFAGAARARGIQRAMLLEWDLPTTDRWPLARVEVGSGQGSEWVRGAPTSPADLEVLDRTVRVLSLPAPARALDPRTVTVEGAKLAERLADSWLGHVLALGALTGDGYLWLTEREPGHLVLEAFASHEPTLDDYLDEADTLVAVHLGRVPPGSAEQTSTPVVPSARRLAGFGPLTRRAIVLAVTTLVRITFNSGNVDLSRADQHREMLDALGRLAAEALDADDPVAAVTLCRVADMRLELLRQDQKNDAELPAVVGDLLERIEDCRRLVRTRVLDRSDAAELIRSANVELTILLRRHGATPIPGLPAPAELTRRLYELWDAVLDLMEIDVARLGEQPEAVRHQIGYQLHNYAGFLSSRVSTPADVRRGLELFEEFVVPARQVFFGRTGDFRPLLWSYQNVTRATTVLARLDGEAGRLADARGHAAQGRRWIGQAMDSDYVGEMLRRAAAQGSDEACRFALLAAPALLTAVEFGASQFPDGDLALCERLVLTARTFADRLAREGGRYARLAEIEDIERRLRDRRGSS